MRSDIAITTFYKIFLSGSVILPLTLTLLVYERLMKVHSYSAYDYYPLLSRIGVTVGKIPVERRKK